MRRTRHPYPEEFRREMVELVRAGHSPYEFSREFEPTAGDASDAHGLDPAGQRRGRLPPEGPHSRVGCRIEAHFESDVHRRLHRMK